MQRPELEKSAEKSADKAAEKADLSNPQPGKADVLAVRELVDRRSSLKLHGEYVFEDIKTEAPVSCEWEIKPEVAGLSVYGDLSGTVLLECARCLTEFAVPIDVEIAERYVFDHYVDPHEREKELQAEDFFEVINEEGELDLKDLAHQFLILESANESTCGRPECSFA